MSCYRGVKAAERQSTECETLLNRAQAPVRARSVRRAPLPRLAPARAPLRQHYAQIHEIGLLKESVKIMKIGSAAYPLGEHSVLKSILTLSPLLYQTGELLVLFRCCNASLGKVFNNSVAYSLAICALVAIVLHSIRIHGISGDCLPGFHVDVMIQHFRANRPAMGWLWNSRMCQRQWNWSRHEKE